MSKLYEYIAIIPSAVSPKFGIYTAQERFEQTLETIRTVREKIPNALIVLNDISVVPAPDLKQGLTRVVDVFLDSDSDAEIANVSNLGLKSVGELLLFRASLNYIKQYVNLSKVKRIFKVGARVKICNSFNIGEYDERTIGKYVFKPVTSWMDRNNFQYVTTLWSMHVSCIDHYIEMSSKMMELFSQGLDAEHAHIKCLKDSVYEFDKLHVAHRVAPNGSLCED